MDITSIQNSLLSPESNPKRSGKDLSHRKVLTFKCGELLPVLCKELVPKDYLEVDLASLVRSCLPLNTAAFLRAKIHFDFFFVPMTAIWRNFDKFYYQRDDNYTSWSRGFSYEPNVRIIDIIKACNAGSGVSNSAAARFKLMNLLGYGNWSDVLEASYDTGGSHEAIGAKSLSALPLFAYNRIYNMHYRDSWKDQPFSYDVDQMSADYLDCSSYAGSLIQTTGIGSHLTTINMYYHKYPQDLFMGLLPSQQFGTVSQVSLGSNIAVSPGQPENVLSSFTAADMRWSGQNLILRQQGESNGTTLIVPKDKSLFDVISLRKALAAQKWKEYNARAGWKSSKQARAMFGVTTPDDRKHDVEFIDGYQFPIMVDEVVSQTNTTGSGGQPQLGELAGKVIGVGNGHKIKFSSGERFGYFMCIAYILPQTEYNANGIDKQLVRSVPEDHYMPAYQNLGLEPVFKYELNALGNPNVFDSTLGFTTRYHEYKTETDKVYCDFVSGKGLQSWVTPRRDLANISNVGSIPIQYLYVSPSILDTLFYANADGTLATDQFMANINFDLKMVRPMSDLGLPSL